MRKTKRRKSLPPPPKRPKGDHPYAAYDAEDEEERRLSIGGLIVTILGLMLIGVTLSGLPRAFSIDPLLPAAVGLVLVVVGARMLYHPDQRRS